ncbi:MAG: hypothetical protein P0116_09640 [Candidatus Nitrosocosmicus sp.]|nr:hypothetical protein [Candidatus Nitrosocosmicus sp.]
MVNRLDPELFACKESVWPKVDETVETDSIIKKEVKEILLIMRTKATFLNNSLDKATFNF